jgi:hypothetical protein
MRFFRREEILLAGCTLVSLLVAGLALIGFVTGLFILSRQLKETAPVAIVRPAAPPVYASAKPPAVPSDPAADQSTTPVGPVSEQLADLPGTPDPPAQTQDNGLGQADSGVVLSASPAAVQPPPTPGPFATSPLPTPTLNPSAASIGGVSPLPTPTPTSTPNASPSSVSSGTPSPTPTPTTTPASSGPGRISGRLLFNGVPVNGAAKLILENQGYEQVDETSVASDGSFSFENVPPSGEGYNILFYQEANPEYELEEVISWGWMGPVVVADNATVNVPDMDIALLGLKPINPEPNVSLSRGIPIAFEWSAYPQASVYWVDLVRGEEMQLIWKSAPLQSTSVTFDGQVGGGGLEPGEYWWGVGARRNLGEYTLTVYGYLPVLLIES